MHHWVLRTVGVFAFSFCIFAHAHDENGDYAALRQEMDELTTRVLQNKIIWTGDYTAFVDSFFEEDGIRRTEDSTVGRLRHRLRLGMRATPNQYFRFTGRIAAYKNFPLLDDTSGDVTSQPRISGSLRPSRDALFRIDRMYMDIFPSWRWISGAFGLFPSSEGLPSGLHRLQPRKSTYANINFNVPFAAAVLALHPHEIFKALPETHLWFIYSNSFNPATTSALGYTVEDPVRFATKQASAIYSWVAEVDPKLPFSESTKISLAYSMVKGFKVDDPTELTALRTSTGLNVDPNRSLGDLDRISLHFQTEHIAGTGFNVFIAGAVSPQVSEPAEFEVTQTIVNNPAVAGAPYRGKVGLHGSIIRENRWGKALYTGVTYDFLNRINPTLGPPTFGYEFFLPERDFLPIYTAGEDILARTENIGHSHQFFYTQPITDSMKFHLAYSYLFTRWTNSLFEVSVPAQGPATSGGTTVIAATPGVTSDSLSRAHRHLHAVQLSWMLSF